MGDKYDDAVAYLTANPEQIQPTWEDPFECPHGSLFRFATTTGYRSDGGRMCGCLTEIRAASYLGGSAATDELTAAIRADGRIPSRGQDITVKHLPVFAEWQRRLDLELKRTT